MSASKKEYKRVTVKSLIEMKSLGEKISMLTAYDYTMAKIVDGAGIDVILVGDSARARFWRFIFHYKWPCFSISLFKAS